jgi:hypothetical protein
MLHLPRPPQGKSPTLPPLLAEVEGGVEPCSWGGEGQPTASQLALQVGSRPRGASRLLAVLTGPTLQAFRDGRGAKEIALVP